MSKIDQLRRQREEQHERQELQVPARNTKSAPARSAPSAAAPRRATPGEADLEGKCAACGKVRALVNGLVSNHQKGLGKMCPGSRKGPAPG